MNTSMSSIIDEYINEVDEYINEVDEYINKLLH
jgi:hypothetical protein